MVPTRLTLALLLCAAGGASISAQEAPAHEAASDQPIRVGVNVVMAPVTVLNRQGEYVSGLQPQDFRLLDNSKEQNIHVDVTFIPISLVIAIQANDHVEGMLPKIAKIGAMIQPLITGDQGEAAVMAFDHRFRWVQDDFTSDPNKIEAGLKKLTPGSGSSRMIDAVIESVRKLRSRPANRRRILLLISETRDKGSEGKIRDALMDIQMNNVSVYSVDISRMMAGLTSRPADPRPVTLPPAMHSIPSQVPATPTTVMQTTGSDGASAQFVPLLVEIFKDTKAIFVDNPVEVFTQGTGGTQFSFGKQKGLEEAIEKVGNDIHSQYLITYSPNNTTEGGFHEIVVDVNRANLKIRTRPGYWLASLTK